MVDSTRNSDQAGIFEFPQNVRFFANAIHDVGNVGGHAMFEIGLGCFLAMCGFDSRNCRHDVIEESGDVPVLDTRPGALDCTALGVPEDENHLGTRVFAGIFEASQYIVVHGVASESGDEHVAECCVKHFLHGDPGINAAQNCSVWVLSSCGIGEEVAAIASMCHMVMKSPVAADQQTECFFGREGLLKCFVDRSTERQVGRGFRHKKSEGVPDEFKDLMIE